MAREILATFILVALVGMMWFHIPLVYQLDGKTHTFRLGAEK